MATTACLGSGSRSISKGGSDMHTATSRDGTRFAFWRSGTGRPLLLVHGMVADHTTTWRYVLPQLEQRFTVHAMDPRGRGDSRDGPAHREPAAAHHLRGRSSQRGERLQPRRSRPARDDGWGMRPPFRARSEPWDASVSSPSASGACGRRRSSWWARGVRPSSWRTPGPLPSVRRSELPPRRARGTPVAPAVPS